MMKLKSISLVLASQIAFCALAGQAAAATWEEHKKEAEFLEQTGKIPQAIKAAEKAIAQASKDVGEQSSAAASCWNLLGNLQTDARQFPSAIKSLKKALEINRRVHGNRHANVAVNLSNLGNTSRLAGDSRSAVSFLEDSCAILKALNFTYPVQLNLLGLALSDLGKETEAATSLEQALNHSRRENGFEHEQTTLIAGNYATVLRSTGNLIMAHCLFQQVDEWYSGPVANDPRQHAIFINNHALTCSELGRHGKAITLYEKALRIHKDLNRPDDLERVTVLCNLAISQTNMKLFPAAERNFREAYEIRKLLKSPKADLRWTLDQLKALYDQWGKADKSWQIQKEIRAL